MVKLLYFIMQNLIDGVIRELEQKNFFEAIKYCNQLIAQFPKNYVFYEIRGNCYLETGSFVTAIQSYTEAIGYFKLTEGKSNSDVATLYNRRGYARLKLNLYNEAISDFEKATEYKQDFAEAYNNCGNAHRKLEQYEEALKQCSRAIEYKPDFAEAYNNRGNIYYLFSKSNEAIYDYSRAIELKPNYAGAYYNRGAAYYYLQNKLIEAKSDWEKVLKLNPSYERELKERLDKIDEALELMRREGEIPIVSEPLSLVKEEEQKEPEIEKPEESIETVKETQIEEEHKEPVLEIYDESKTEKHEEVKTEEPEIEKPEEPTIEKVEEPTIEKVEEPTIEKIEEPIVEKVEEPIIEELAELEKLIVEKPDIEKIEEPEIEKAEVTQSSDFEIPDIDFKNMFQEEEKEIESGDDLKPLNEIFEQIYQPTVEKENIIPEEVKQLHKDIEDIPVPSEIKEEKEDKYIEELIEQGSKSKADDVELPWEPNQKEKASELSRMISPSYLEDKEERSIFKSPIFIIPLIFLVLVIFAISSYWIYNKFYTRKLQNSKEETTTELKDTNKLAGNIDSTQIKDTIEDKQIKTEAKEEGKQKEQKEEKTTPDVTMIKNFVVIKEQDGIYLQIASLKEKSSADTKAASISKKNINAKVIEADLGSKGKYYRVRIGPFKTIDEAKTAANKIE